MKITLIVVLLIYAIYLLRKSKSTSGRITSSKHFFSFGVDLTPASLRRAFETTNASFTTSFVAAFLFAFAYGAYAFVIPASFCIGIIFYATVLLPKQMKAFQHNERYPELLGSNCGSTRVRKIVSVAVCFSLFVFTFAELQGLQMFLVKLLGDDSLSSVLIPFGLLLLVAIYTSQSGYRAVISNDRLQLNLIRAGLIAMFGLVVYSVIQTFHGLSLNASQAAFESALRPSQLSSPETITLFVVETVVGFLFSQLLYYDNWQRLSFYVSEKSKLGMPRDSLVTQVRVNYIWGSVELFFIYLVPIVLGISLHARGDDGSIDSLANFMVQSWSSIPVPMVGPIAVILAILFMVNALVSTAEVYIVAIVNNIMEDILNLLEFGQNSETKPPTRREDLTLYGSRMLTFVICMSFLPFVLLRPNFEQLFSYMFYSANGLVGPLILASFGRRQSPTIVLASLGFGLIYPGIPYLWPSLGAFAPFPGFVTVAVSLFLSGCWVLWVWAAGRRKAKWSK